MMMKSSDYPLDNLQFSTTCLDKPKKHWDETQEEYEERCERSIIKIPKDRSVKGKKAYQSKWPS